MIRPWTMRREQHAGAPSEKNSYNQPNIRFHILEAKCTSPYENWTPVLHISNNIAWTEHTSCNQLCYRLPSDDLGIAGRPCTLLPSDHLFLIAWLRLLLARWNDSIFVLGYCLHGFVSAWLTQTFWWNMFVTTCVRMGLFQPLSTVSEGVYNLLFNIIKLSPDLRNMVLTWLGKCLHLNAGWCPQPFSAA